MLRVTADVNGRPIGQLFVHNTGWGTVECPLYDAATWDANTGDGVFGIEAVPHEYNKHWLVLVFEVLTNLGIAGARS